MTVKTECHDGLQHIRLVEDDVRLSALIKEYLEQHQYRVSIEGRGDTAVQRILQDTPDLVVLDLMLPGLDGMDVCRQVRAEFRSPILMLTARDEDIDQVVGLELGADDYVIKPVKPRVLLARIQNLLRRQSVLQSDKEKKSVVTIGEFMISSDSRETLIEGNPILLTSQEFDLGVRLKKTQLADVRNAVALRYDLREREMLTERAWNDELMNMLERRHEKSFPAKFTQLWNRSDQLLSGVALEQKQDNAKLIASIFRDLLNSLDDRQKQKLVDRLTSIAEEIRAMSAEKRTLSLYVSP